MSREEMVMPRVPKVRMKSPRTRERRWAVMKAVITPVTPVGMKRMVVWITERPWYSWSLGDC